MGRSILSGCGLCLQFIQGRGKGGKAGVEDGGGGWEVWEAYKGGRAKEKKANDG